MNEERTETRKEIEEKEKKEKEKKNVTSPVFLFFDVLFQNNFITTNYIFTLLTENVRKNRSGYVSFLSMQQTQTQNTQNPRLSTSSHSSLSAATNALLNGLLPPHRFSQASTNAPILAANLTPNQLKELQRSNNKLKRSRRIKQTSIIICLTIILVFLLLITIEFGSKLVKISPELHLSKSLTINSTKNLTITEHQYPIHAFFTCVWFFNALLFINCLIVHSIAIQRRSRRGRTTAVFLRYCFIRDLRLS
jgi:hypothetical protein